jgi:4,5-DOPA dioxygenase extradiol
MNDQPVLFVSHGSPMLALEGPEHPYVRSLGAYARSLPARPRGILAVSAHWVSREPRVTSGDRPGVVHDFFGFPPELGRMDYPAPGDPSMAARVALATGARPDPARGLDHGVWAVLRHLFPAADVPVVQVSLPPGLPEGALDLGRRLRPFREEGWLVLASGGLVHNLGEADSSAPEGAADPWALEAEAWIMDALARGDLRGLLDHRALWPGSRRAAPTTEHLDPLFVALGAAGTGEAPRTVHEGWQLANLGLRCLAW